MSSDAKFYIWVGFKFNDTGDWEEFRDKHLKGIVDEDNELTPRANKSEQYKNLEIFWCSEEVCGFGVGVFHHDWNDDVTHFDSTQVNNKAIRALGQMLGLERKWQTEKNIQVWCQADFS